MAAAAVTPATESGPPAAADAKRRAPFHIPSLDGLRAISFLIVFVSHAGLDSVVPGGFGVTVFFFLSGYLITTLMRIEAARTGHVSLKNFYVRRALRILPPFYIVLAAATVLAEVGYLRGVMRPQPLAVLSQVLHVSNYWITARGWSGIPTGTGVYWSLAVEEHFYLVFPAVFLLLTRLRIADRRAAFAFWAACAVVLVWRCVLVFLLHAGTERTFLCSDTRVDSIAFGCALAVWNNPVLDDLPPGEQGIRQASLWRNVLFPAGVGLLLLTFLVRGPAFRETVRYSLQGAALTPIFVTAIRWPEWRWFRPLNWRPMRFMGTLSYTLYLVHQAVLALIEQHAPVPWDHGPARAVVALAVSIALAWAMHRLVERPCAKLRRRFSAAD